MTALFAVLAGAALLMSIFGEGSDRAWGWISFVMFGVGGAAWVVGEWLTPPAQQPHGGMVSLPSGAVVPALILPLREGKVRASVVGTAAFFVASSMVAIFPEAFGLAGVLRLFWVAIAVLLGWGLAAAIRRRRQRDYLLALSHGGILSRLPTEASFVPWQAVRGAGIVERLGQNYLTLHLDRSARGEQERGFPSDNLANRLMTGHDWSFPLAALPIEPADVLALVRDYLDDPERRSHLGSSPAPILTANGR